MCKEEAGKIQVFLEKRIGETRELSDWCQQINNERLIRRKLTKRELAYIFNRALNNKFIIEHHLVHYTFFR